ncbi:type I restriction-modification system subunit M [Gracilimonas mengyeensis]|uniref:site-specific DNA-methyltransferase (adenine-specific) n=1 Tax=Gracilimonas mengyeensis TaxID=1302730 RepID=A0A521BMP0_9BACT|nr:class I SAM-dependent DNA methyltransferase [Gracilimonas mengyeensis]SMO48375.1 type I restriction enzyme M protein [Gracilimonas mengyeensis]
MQKAEQEFLKDLDKKLWSAADKLRNNLDAAVYKHVVLGLIFLKYVSDAFEERREELRKNFRDPDHDYYIPQEDMSDEEYDEFIEEELEIRDYYIAKNVFWVPPLARWETLKKNHPLPNGTEIELPNGETYKMKSTAHLIDDANGAIENENPELKNILDRTYSQKQLPADKLGELINLFSDANFNAKEYKGKPLSINSKDILGHVYEYFLGEFALAEGKKGGQYYTPKSIVKLMVRMLKPFEGRVYDPAMGSGGFFVQSEDFIEEYGGKIGQISVYGQESNPTTWKLAAMNMAIRGIDFDFGKEPADSFTNDQHKDLRADYVMANPPFNVKDWWNEKLADDPRWEYGTPPEGNANFAWLQHMLYHLAPSGSLALLLANGSMSSQTSGEGEIRKNLLENDLVECMVALPGQLFTNTQIPACIWFLSKNKTNGTKTPDGKGKGDRSGTVLFIDAREKGYMKDRVLRDFKPEEIKAIAKTYSDWQQDNNDYEDIPGYCKSATLEEIQKNDYVLTPGRYVGAPETEDDGIPFPEKMKKLTTKLKSQFEESEALEEKIKENLAGLGYE